MIKKRHLVLWVAFSHTLFVLFFQNTSTVVTACADSTVRIFDLSLGKLKATLQGPYCSIDFMRFDGQLLITASSDRYTQNISIVRTFQLRSFEIYEQFD